MTKPLEKIGKYVALEEQEKPGIGTLWRGAELAGDKIARHVLIDLIDAELAGDPNFVSSLMSQSLVSAKLEHPNILRKVTAIDDPGKVSSVYEHQEGFTLAKVLERCQTDMYPFSVDHALLVTSKLLSALTYAKGRHLSHGFVNPTMVYITHEGEVKLRGFSYATALRASGKKPTFSDRVTKYVPRGIDPLAEDRDKLDIFACGSILYEMLVGEPFNKSDGDAAAVIGSARTDADSEPIPPKIAKILVSALGIGRPDAYTDVAKMAGDMENLLLSGEYSPTTFNLAFFMHSAFREEMESLSTKIKSEKEKRFGAAAAAPPTAPPKRAKTPPAAKAGTPRPASPEVKPRVGRQERSGSSKVPLIIGGAAVLLVVIVLAVLFIPRGGGETDRFDDMAQAMQQEGLLEEQRMKTKRLEVLEAENRSLKEELRIIREREKQQQILRYQEEIAAVDQQIAKLSEQQNREQRNKEMAAELEALRKKNEALQESQREARLELQKSQDEALQEALAAGDTEGESGTEREQPVDPAPEPVTPTEPAVDPAESTETAANASRPREREKPAEKTAAPAPLEEPEPELETTAAATPPVKKPEPVMPEYGEIVDINDELLEKPVVLENYDMLEAPRRAVRAGLVKRDGTLSFILKVLIDTNGRVEDVQIYRNPIAQSKDDFGMIEKAEKAALRLRYTPPTKMGVRVKCWNYVPIHFRGK